MVKAEFGNRWRFPHFDNLGTFYLPAQYNSLTRHHYTLSWHGDSGGCTTTEENQRVSCPLRATRRIRTATHTSQLNHKNAEYFSALTLHFTANREHLLPQRSNTITATHARTGVVTALYRLTGSWAKTLNSWACDNVLTFVVCTMKGSEHHRSHACGAKNSCIVTYFMQHTLQKRKPLPGLAFDQTAKHVYAHKG